MTLYSFNVYVFCASLIAYETASGPSGGDGSLWPEPSGRGGGQAPNGRCHPPAVRHQAGEEAPTPARWLPAGLCRAGEEVSARPVDHCGRRHTGEEAVCGHHADKDFEDPHITSPNHRFLHSYNMFLCHCINVSMLIRQAGEG